MRILILEDDELLGPMLARQLRRRRHETVLVTSINSAREFLAKIEDSGLQPECILTDRDLPDGNGWDWARNLPYPYTVQFMSGKLVENATYWHKGAEPLDKLFQLIEK
jgi:DNA-binding response OmpR family regulator